jgi:hypothetical protein
MLAEGLGIALAGIGVIATGSWFGVPMHAWRC